MISEVERNSKLIRVNDVLYYRDQANNQQWVVVEIFEGGFVAKDDYEKRDYYFSELQYGWSISEKTKEKHVLDDKFVYATTNKLSGDFIDAFYRLNTHIANMELYVNKLDDMELKMVISKFYQTHARMNGIMESKYNF